MVAVVPDIPSPQPCILVMGPMPVLADDPDCGLTLLRYWEAADSGSFLDLNGPAIRGLATGSGSAVDAALLAKLPNVEIITGFGVGYENIDVAEAERRGIIVTNAGDTLTEEVADLAMGLLIATLRQLPQADRHVRVGKWPSGSFPLTLSLRGRTVGIVGLGRIGKAIARRLDASLVEVAYTGRHRQADVARPYHPSVLALAQAADTLILAAPGGAETRHMVDAAVLGALGPQGVVINIGRGSLINETALVAALENGTIAGAGLDVFEDEPNVPPELIAREDVVLLPHVGSASTYTRRAMGQQVLDNLQSWFAGNGPLSPIAETPWPAN